MRYYFKRIGFRNRAPLPDEGLQVYEEEAWDVLDTKEGYATVGKLWKSSPVDFIFMEERFTATTTGDISAKIEEIIRKSKK